MSERAVIDGLEFARSGQELKGRLSVSEFGRLQDCLFDGESTIDFVLTGVRDTRKRLALRIAIIGLLGLQCQRCLGLLEYPLQMQNTLLLVRESETPPADDGDPDAPECVIANAAMDVATLIEDEILLALPLSPRHPDGACSVGARLSIS